MSNNCQQKQFQNNAIFQFDNISLTFESDREFLLRYGTDYAAQERKLLY